jgi:hypothetical protein
MFVLIGVEFCQFSDHQITRDHQINRSLATLPPIR